MEDVTQNSRQHSFKVRSFNDNNMQNPQYVFSISKVMTICISALTGIAIKSLLVQPMYRSLMSNRVLINAT